MRRAKILKRGSRSMKNHDEFGLHIDKMEDYHMSNKMVKSKTLLDLNHNNNFSDIIYQMNNNINHDDFNNNIINNDNEKSHYLLVNKFNIEEDVNDKENNAGLNNNTLLSSKKDRRANLKIKVLFRNYRKISS